MFFQNSLNNKESEKIKPCWTGGDEVGSYPKDWLIKSDIRKVGWSFPPGVQYSSYY